MAIVLGYKLPECSYEKLVESRISKREEGELDTEEILDEFSPLCHWLLSPWENINSHILYVSAWSWQWISGVQKLSSKEECRIESTRVKQPQVEMIEEKVTNRYQDGSRKKRLTLYLYKLALSQVSCV